PRGAVALLRRDRLRGGRRAFGERLDVPELLALLTECTLRAGLEPCRVLDERAQLGQPLLAHRLAGNHFLVAAARRAELAPRLTSRRTQSVVGGERIEHVQLEG